MLFMQKGIWGRAAARWEIQLFPVRKLLVRQKDAGR
jgi:hypothetical protein